MCMQRVDVSCSCMIHDVFILLVLLRDSRRIRGSTSVFQIYVVERFKSIGIMQSCIAGIVITRAYGLI
jgi:hypothetical protein